MSVRRWASAGALVCVLWLPVGADAQPTVSSLGELTDLASRQATVTVTDATGQDTSGRLIEASDAGLVLTTGRDTRRFDVDEIRSVRVRTSDSLVNGALIGAAVGGGLTSLIFLDNECHDDPACFEAVAAYAGIGALAGLAVDTLIRRSAVVFTAPGGPPSAAVAMGLILERHRRGVRLWLAF